MLLPFPAQHLNALRHCEARLALANRRASSRIPILSYGFEFFLDFRAQPNFPINVPKLPHGEVWGLGIILFKHSSPIHVVHHSCTGAMDRGFLPGFLRHYLWMGKFGEVAQLPQTSPSLPHPFLSNRNQTEQLFLLLKNWSRTISKANS